MDADLREFTRRALEQGIAREEVGNGLRAAGWADADIKAAIDSFASIPFPLPIPKPKPYLSAREVFLYLVLFTAFYTSAYALGSLAFDFINRIFPDPLFSPAFSRGADGANDDIRWNVSTLLVSFPLFLYMFRHVNNAVNLDPTSGRQNPGGG